MLATTTGTAPPTSLRLINALVHVALVLAVLGPASWILGAGGTLSVEARVLRAPGIQLPALVLDAYPTVHHVTAKVEVGEGGRAAAAALVATLAVLGFVFLWQLRGITRAALAGTAFDPKNATRLRRMGWALMAVGLSLPFHAALAMDALAAVEIPGVRLQLARPWDLSFFVYALVLFGLAGALARDGEVRNAKALAPAPEPEA